MPKVRALTPDQAKRTLANRFGPRVDRIRQFNTRFGVRPYRCFLVWMCWGGSERGEGTEKEVKRVEILPTPQVTDLTAQTLTAFSGGVLPVGSVRVTQISTQYTFDVLSGLAYPQAHEDRIPADVNFFWEIVEDGRGDPQPLRARYRVNGVPFRAGGQVQWMVVLERASQDLDRSGRPPRDE